MRKGSSSLQDDMVTVGDSGRHSAQHQTAETAAYNIVYSKFSSVPASHPASTPIATDALSQRSILSPCPPSTQQITRIRPEMAFSRTHAVFQAGNIDEAMLFVIRRRGDLPQKAHLPYLADVG